VGLLKGLVETHLHRLLNLKLNRATVIAKWRQLLSA
jgi:hypothetical protein